MDSDTIRVTGAGGAPAVESEAPAVDSAEPDGSGGREGLVGPVGLGGRGALGSGLGGGAACSEKVVFRGGGRGIQVSRGRGGKTKAHERPKQSRVSGRPIRRLHS